MSYNKIKINLFTMSTTSRFSPYVTTLFYSKKYLKLQPVLLLLKTQPPLWKWSIAFITRKPHNFLPFTDHKDCHPRFWTAVNLSVCIKLSSSIKYRDILNRCRHFLLNYLSIASTSTIKVCSIFIPYLSEEKDKIN